MHDFTWIQTILKSVYNETTPEWFVPNLSLVSSDSSQENTRHRICFADWLEKEMLWGLKLEIALLNGKKISLSVIVK